MKWVLLWALSSSSAAAQDAKEPGSLLLGGGLGGSFKAAPMDPRLPRGPRLQTRARPRPARTLCSQRRPLCVHGPPQPELLRRALGHLEEAYDWLVVGQEAPAPIADGLAGGGPELDLYLSPETERVQAVTELELWRGDGTPAYCVAPTQGDVAADALACLIRAVSLRLDAAENEASRGGLSDYLAWQYGCLSNTALTAIDRAQSNPQLGPASASGDGDAEYGVGSLFWAFLDTLWNQGEPGLLPLAMFQLSQRPLGMQDAHPQWHNEPDVLDVVRAALDNDLSREAQLLGNFALSRLFLGDRSDGRHHPGLAWLGQMGRIKFDWRVPYSSLPRNLISERALEPLGSVYLWLDLDQVPLGARLGVRLQWEGPVRFQWVAVALNAQGEKLSRWDFPYIESGTVLEKTLLHFENAHSLVLVGTNLGGIDLSHPLDPDVVPWEPHRATIYLAPLPSH